MADIRLRAKKSLRQTIADRLARWSFDMASALTDSQRLDRGYRGDEGYALKLLTLNSEEASQGGSFVFADDLLIQEIGEWTLPIHVPLSAVGGRSSDVDPLVAVTRRAVTEDMAFVLFRKQSAQEPIRPLAFASLSTARDNSNILEIGKARVKNEDRATQGYGQALLTNIAQLVSISTKNAEIFARVFKGNQPALAMFRDISRFAEVDFQECSDSIHLLQEYELPWADFRWYRWNSKPRANQASFGECFRELREDRKITQQVVSQRAEITREALNQIEHGANPSPDNLEILLSALTATRPLSSRERTRLFFSLGGHDIPSDVIFVGTVDQDIRRSKKGGTEVHYSRWVVTDRPPELVDPSEINATIAAIAAGFERYFFVSRSDIGAPCGMPLVRRILVGLEELDLPRRHLRQVLWKLRLFVAPSAICRIRLHVLGAKFEDGRFGTPLGVSMAGPGSERIDLSQKQYQYLYEDLCDAIRPSLDLPPESSERISLADGFEYIPLPRIDFDFCARLN